MIQLLGWLGFLLYISTLAPFVLRRLRLWPSGASFFSLRHHGLALASLAVLTLHGFLALTGRQGWGWGIRAKHYSIILSGTFAWIALIAVAVLAMAVARQKPFPRTHCLIAALLLLLALIHVF